MDRAFFFMVVGESVSFGEFETFRSASFGSLGGSLGQSSASAASGSAYGSIDG